MSKNNVINKVMLITGASQRIGEFIAKSAHNDGFNIVLHYRQSSQQTQDLTNKLNNLRSNSCINIQADFNQHHDFTFIHDRIVSQFGSLDVLVNNASDFIATDLPSLQLGDYDKLFNSNVRGPLFLSKHCYPLLQKTQGCIVNIVDIHSVKPLKNYPTYSMAKAANNMMVKAMAKEFAPNIRVNGISPGCIIWPKEPFQNDEKKAILSRIALERKGHPVHIYQTLRLLIENTYITGEIVNVDGGRSLNM